MQNFGYLEKPQSNEPNGLTAEFLYGENAIIDGIKNIQKFGGIAETGRLDRETIKLFSAPRCGVKDLDPHSRNKRYIVGSKGWDKRGMTY